MHFSTIFYYLFGYCLATCPSFTTRKPDLALENTSNHTGGCPSVLVTSEEKCLKEFCKLVDSNENCHGNAVQYTKTGIGLPICYILELHNCKSCKFAHNKDSTILYADWTVDDKGSSGEECPEMHRCANGDCVPQINKCDDIRDCPDMSDEEGCPQYTSCDAPNYFQCKSDGECVPVTSQCDGIVSCADGSDERGCSAYLSRRTTNTTLTITAISVGVVLSLLLIILMFACGQKLYTSHFEQRERLRNLRLGSSGADYVVRLLPGEAPFQDTLPPSYTDSVMLPCEDPPQYEPQRTLDRLLDIAESSGYVSPPAAKDTRQSTDSSNLLSPDSPGPSLQGDKLDSDLMTGQSTGDLLG